MPGGFFFLEDTLSGVLALEAGSLVPEAERRLEDEADRVRDYARTNAPWADRTGDARNGLDTDVSREGTEIVLTLFHTVDYGLWLETINSGEFAIIIPTLEALSQDIMRSVGAIETGGLE